MDKQLHPNVPWDVIIHQSPNFRGSLTEARAYMNDYIPLLCVDVILYSCHRLDNSLANLCLQNMPVELCFIVTLFCWGIYLNPLV